MAVILVTAYGAWALTKPLPALQPINALSQLTVPAKGSHLAWPAAGQSAVGILDSRILETHGDQKPVPIASVAKVINALVVMQKKPLALGEQGPAITLTQNDVAIHDQYAAQDGSLLPVQAGEKLTEYQMLQALMLPSANNIADTMAIWAYGSLSNYANVANAFLKQNGLNSTHVGSDASGMSPTTTSTAADLVKLGDLAMKNPVLAQVVGQQTASGLPLTTQIKNVNMLLGTNNIIGIKTGNTDQAGGVFLSASRININNTPVIIITAEAGQPDLFTALKTSNDLVKSAQTNFTNINVVKAGQKITTYKIPWGGTIDAVATKNINLTQWNGWTTFLTISARPVAYNSDSTGVISLPASAINPELKLQIKLRNLPAKPSALWRLTHP